MSNNTSGKTPPISPPIGSIWYNTTTNLFYVLNQHYDWELIDDETTVFNTIIKDIPEDPVEAYNRAMRVI